MVSIDRPVGRAEVRRGTKCSMGMKKLFVCSMIFFTSQMFDGLNQLNVRWFAKSAICSIYLTQCLEINSIEKDGHQTN